MKTILLILFSLFPQYAYCDTSGEEFASTQYEKMGRFVEGLAPVGINGKWGFVNSSGTLVIPAVYDSWNYFSKGLAYVGYHGLSGQIDKTGVMVKPQRMVQLSMSTNAVSGIIPFISDGKVGYRRIAGAEISPAVFDDGGAFVEGFAPVKKGNVWGYIDITGKLAIKPEYDMAYGFYNGLAIVLKNEKWGYIGTGGSLEIPNSFDEARRFSEGLAAVRKGFKWGYIDRAGKIVIEPQYEAAGPFSAGKAIVQISENAPAGFPLSPIMRNMQIGRDGAMIYSSVGLGGSFRDLQIIVSSSGQYGLVSSPDNSVVVEPRYEELKRPDSGTLFIFKDKGKYGYLDMSGSVTIPPKYDQAEFFRGDFAVVKMDGKYGVLNSSGVFAIPAEYDALSWKSSSTLSAVFMGKSGYTDVTNAVFSPIPEVADLEEEEIVTSTESASALLDELTQGESLCDYLVRKIDDYEPEELVRRCGAEELQKKAEGTGCAKCYLYLARFYARKGSTAYNPYSAIDIAGKAIELSSSTPEAYKLRADVLMDYDTELGGSFVRAFNDYLKLLELEPENNSYKADLCHAAGKNPFILDQAKREISLQACNDLLSGSEKGPEGHVSRAGILAASGNTDAAIADLDAALRADKNNGAALLAKARVYESTKDWRRAAFYYSRTIETAGKYVDSDIYESRGVCNLRLGSCEKAAADFFAAGKRLDSVVNWHHMAAYHWTCGRDITKALDYVEKLLKLGEECEGPCYRPEAYVEFLSGLTRTKEHQALLGRYGHETK